MEKKPIKVNLDNRNRVPLTKMLEGCEAKTFKIYWEEDRLILEPLVEIPERELWVYKNKDVLGAMERGLEDAKEGRVTELNLSEFLDRDHE